MSTSKTTFKVKGGVKSEGNAVVDARTAEFLNDRVPQSLIPGTTVVIPKQVVHLEKLSSGMNGKFVFVNVFDKDGKYLHTTSVGVSSFQRTTYGTDPNIVVELIDREDSDGIMCIRASYPAFDTNIDVRLRTIAQEIDGSMTMVVPEPATYHIEKGQIHMVTSMEKNSQGGWDVVGQPTNRYTAKLDRRYYPNIVTAPSVNGRDQLPEECSGYML